MSDYRAEQSEWSYRNRLAEHRAEQEDAQGCAEPAATGASAPENTHKDSACSECSRLASRVEELEMLVAKAAFFVSFTKAEFKKREDFEGLFKAHSWEKLAESALAGAHAEEKE